MAGKDGVGRRRPGNAALVAAALPWSWFVVRDRASLLDVVATGLPVVVAGLAAVALLAAAVFRRATPLVAAVSLLAVGAVAVVGPWMPAGGGTPATPLRVVTANAFDFNDFSGEAAADIRAQDADLVVVVEGASTVGARLRSEYPFSETAGVADHLVVSRFPVRFLSGLPEAPDDGRVSRWELTAPAGRVVVYGVHLRRPEPRDGAVRAPLLEQRLMIDALLRAVERETAPVLVVGDFNFSDRTWAYRRLAGRLRDAGRATWAGPTYIRIRYRPFLLRIDHLFVAPEWCSGHSARFTITGSDHRGVVADVGPCPD